MILNIVNLSKLWLSKLICKANGSGFRVQIRPGPKLNADPTGSRIENTSFVVILYMKKGR
jgi:hypothetical protein